MKFNELEGGVCWVCSIPHRRRHLPVQVSSKSECLPLTTTLCPELSGQSITHTCQQDRERSDLSRPQPQHSVLDPTHKLVGSAWRANSCRSARTAESCPSVPEHVRDIRYAGHALAPSLVRLRPVHPRVCLDNQGDTQAKRRQGRFLHRRADDFDGLFGLILRRLED